MKPAMIGTGIAAGLVATVVLSAMMLLKRSMGLMPELDPIAMITAMAGASSPAVGWIGHFVIGSIFWGVGFAIVSPYLLGPYRCPRADRAPAASPRGHPARRAGFGTSRAQSRRIENRATAAPRSAVREIGRQIGRASCRERGCVCG